jgi:predicted negative regulator of RcsB-dependent stress response
MTTPNTTSKSRYGASEESFNDWILLHKRAVTWAIVVVAALVAIFWFMQRQRTIKAQRAESAYFQARRSVAAGNMPLAISDLQKVATRYEGTLAGTQASLTLAQTFYEQKKFKEGVEALKKAESSASDDLKASIYVLEADGYEEMKNFGAAAEQYKLAVQATRFPAEKTHYQAAAARAYMAAGKLAEAKAIWTELAKDETGADAAEAKVRLGEVSAQPVKI